MSDVFPFFLILNYLLLFQALEKILLLGTIPTDVSKSAESRPFIRYIDIGIHIPTYQANVNENRWFMSCHETKHVRSPTND